MRPRADEVLRSAIETYDMYILPEVNEPFAASLAITVGNLMRHVLARIEREGQLLFEDIADVTEVLRSARAYVEGAPVAAVGAIGPAIDAALLARSWEEGQYPSLALVIDRATVLRQALDDLLRALQAARPQLGTDPGYRALRRDIRAYLRRQLERQATWDTDALVGERR